METPIAHRLVYAPHLHRECAPACLPAVVEFLSPGLENAAGQNEWRSPLLPFAPAEARAVLRDLLEYGLSLGKEGDLQALAASMDDGGISTDARRERMALEHFASDGRIDPAPVSAAETLSMKHQTAQKTLLLAWHLEERAQELDALRDRFMEGRTGLAGTIGIDDDDIDELPDMPSFSVDLPGEGLDLLRPSWRVVLDNMAPFLPEDGALFTCDSVMLGGLREAGIELGPVTVDILRGLEGLDAALAPRLVHARTHLWRALGHGNCPADRPWLAREIFIFGCAACDA